MKRGIRLRGVSGTVKGKVWHSEHLLRSGRLNSLEIVLDDSSVSRKHAEVRAGNDGCWSVIDLNSTNGTYINGQRIAANVDHPIKGRDIVQFGKIAMIVEFTEATLDGPPSDQLTLAAKLALPASSGMLSASKVLSAPAPRTSTDHMPRAGDQLIALLRAGQHLIHLQSEDQLLDTILNDAVSVLDAQRGAIVLAGNDNVAEPRLQLRSLAVGPREPGGRFPFSRRLAQKAFAAGESMLFKNLREEEFQVTQSISDGAMGSVLCVLLRTPRRRIGVLHLDRSVYQSAFTENDLMFADALAAHMSSAVECAHLLRQQRELFLKTITTLADMVELRDRYTGGHTRRVTQYSIMLAEKLDLPEEQIELVRTGTPLHDIGKIGIPDAILQKPGRLTAKEFAEMQTHTTQGAQYLANIPELATILPIVRNHHERWDGTGYPDRLAGEEIPLLARIVAVCDAFDAMTSDRPYHENKKGKPPEVAFAEIARQMGRQFDPQCAAAFLEISDSIRRVMSELQPGVDATTPAPRIVGANSVLERSFLTGDSISELNGSDIAVGPDMSREEDTLPEYRTHPEFQMLSSDDGDTKRPDGTGVQRPVDHT
ncbi:HD domain-containing phosphohydrolase [Limnoglobus roseus]|uniref:HD domain-containing protein n=1 Tax=Limnoglobus roseus TaxID=2598579 RepID=A0A5C1ABH3_9BACT|nr:HD domain-containing phosphohydrolase [Limnoglobus roseus]QEL14484.1 HD domain-containing protein [Limnoglobus roseus]